MKKNDIYTVELTDTCSNGCGFCRIDGQAVFVKNGICGELCEIKIIKVCKSYCVATVTKTLKNSEYRITPLCTSKACGGCVFSQISPEYENEIKAEFVAAALKKEGLADIKVAQTRSAGGFYSYRNKAQLPVAYEDGKIKVGFFAQKSHRIVESEMCAINPPVFSHIAYAVKAFCEEYGVSAYDEKTHGGTLRHIYLRCTKNAQRVMLCLVTSTEEFTYRNELTEYIMREFPCVCGIYQNVNPDDTNVVLGKKFILWYGEEKLCDTLCGKKFMISPESFYQVNRECCELLYTTAARLLNANENDTVLDLYCGIGSVGICTCSNAKKLVGVEIVPEAVENAKQNARLNGMKNAEFFAADAADTLRFTKKLGYKFTAVTVDPPRKGLSPEVIELISSLNVERVLYISCDYSTLCRDIKRFAEKGYTTNEVIPVNMFPRTSHVETVCLLSRKDK